MKSLSLLIVLAALVLVSPARSEILVFKNGQIIETHYSWKESRDKIGFFYNGKEFYANKSDIDWKKTEEMNKAGVTLKAKSKKPVVSAEEFTARIKKSMGAHWKIRRVTLTQGSLRITTAIRSLSSEDYNRMVALVCQDLKAHPGIAKKLKEVVFLSKWETQGFVFTAPVKFNEILLTPDGEVNAVIADYTQKHRRD